MSEQPAPVVKSVGQFGPYNVRSTFIEKRFFVKLTKGPDAGKSIPVRHVKRILTLQHDGGTIVEFSTYPYRGQPYYRDSRDKSGKPTSRHVVSEIRRMLGVSETQANALLGGDSGTV